MSEPEKQKAERRMSDRSEVRDADPLPVLDFDRYAAGGLEILIEFRGQQYRLRVTRNGGLILNK